MFFLISCLGHEGDLAQQLKNNLKHAVEFMATLFAIYKNSKQAKYLPIHE